MKISFNPSPIETAINPTFLRGSLAFSFSFWAAASFSASLISLYYGEEVSEEEAEKLTAEIEELYPDMDVDAHMGGQPIYYYVLAVE